MTDQIPLTDITLSATNLTPQQVRDASLVLAGHATGADELAEWLEACGLRSYQSADRLWHGRAKSRRQSRGSAP